MNCLIVIKIIIDIDYNDIDNYVKFIRKIHFSIKLTSA